MASFSKFFKRPAVWVPLLAIATFAAGMAIMWAIETHRLRQGRDHERKLAEMLGLIKDEYVDVVDIDSLLETVYPDLLGALDPHSVYIPASDLEEVNSELDGSFSGVGISFNMLNDTINVLEVISGGPSEKVGLLPGDRIVTIDDSVASGRKWSNERVIKLLRGPEGTKVRLGIRRSTARDLLPFEVTRGPIPVSSVDAAYLIDDSTGYIRINKFSRNTFNEFFTNVVSLRALGADRLIVDLRGNGGGYMQMAILMANEFLPAGRHIVATRGRVDDADSDAVSDGNGSLQGMEVAVLLDEFSASASEIFAGALQDNDRGLIIGRRSFGKGLVQRQTDLTDGSAVRLTIARYYTPSGRSIQKTYTHGATAEDDDYATEVFRRYQNGESFNADSIKFDKQLLFTTLGGRTVYGGGGIMPDVFVPVDSASYTSYWHKVLNGALLHRYAFRFSDQNRARYASCTSTDDLLDALPADDDLLNDFVAFAKAEGVPARWYYINISRDLIVNSLKALIARSLLGSAAYYEVYNPFDPDVQAALRELDAGNAKPPVKLQFKTGS